MPKYTGQENCSGGELETFFRGQGNMYHLARDTCEGCPLLDPCFSYALTNDVAGFWGGTAETDRKKIRKLLGIKPIPINAGLTALGIFQGVDLPHQGHSHTISNNAAALWEALDEQEAFAVRDQVLEARVERRQRASEHARQNGYLTRASIGLFTDDQVREIRASGDSARLLANRYGVSADVIRRVRIRRTYADVQDVA